MNEVTRPVLRWHGGKWRLAPWIISHFPRHAIYVEPFGGAASVLLLKEAIAAECYNDLDGTVVNVFRVLRDPAKAAELERRLRLTPYARAEFDWSYAPARDDVDGAHKTIIRSFMGFGSDSVTRSCRTGFRAKPSDARAFPSQSWATFADCIPQFVGRLAGVIIEQRDAIEIARRYDRPSTLVYADPPYLHETRSSLTGRSKRVHGYVHELTERDHVRLIGGLKKLKSMVVLSGYASPMYEQRLKGWKRVETNSLADGARPRIEVVWLNPACAAALERERGGHGTPLFPHLEAAE
jgi:DNA adenine methylase